LKKRDDKLERKESLFNSKLDLIQQSIQQLAAPDQDKKQPFESLKADSKNQSQMLQSFLEQTQRRRRAESFDVINHTIQQTPDKDRKIHPVVLINNLQANPKTQSPESEAKELEEQKLELVRQQRNRKMTMQVAVFPKEPEKETKPKIELERKNTVSAFVPIKDNISKKSIDETSMFLRNSVARPDKDEALGFALPVSNLVDGCPRRESDIGLPNPFSQNSKLEGQSPLRHQKSLIGARDGLGLEAKERQDSLQPRKPSNYVQIFNSIYNYKIASAEKDNKDAHND